MKKNIGDWGLGIGDWGLGIWGLGIGDWAQSPIPNPHIKNIYLIFIKLFNIFYYLFIILSNN
jgi:hypothetical protein